MALSGFSFRSIVVPGVSMFPSTRSALTQIPCGCTSRASTPVRPSRAAFEAV